MKIFLLIGAALLGIIIFGLSLPAIIPGCTCGFPASKCHGCGELIGNALGDFSGTCFILGAMGFVFLLWFGIPLALIGGVAFGLYSLLKKREVTPEKVSEYLRGASGTTLGGFGFCPNCSEALPLSAPACPKCKALFGAGSSWTVQTRQRDGTA
jgi:hypothetical protein